MSLEEKVEELSRLVGAAILVLAERLETDAEDTASIVEDILRVSRRLKNTAGVVTGDTLLQMAPRRVELEED